MPVSMLVKCEKCGYENFPQHRYCGMCAAPLRLPGPGGGPSVPPPERVPSPVVTEYPPPRYKKREDVVTPAKEAAQRQVSGPSFLGLGNEPAEDKSASYLLEDETPSHRGRNLILILLIAGLAVAAWQRRQDLQTVAYRVLNPQAPAKAGAPDNPAANPPAPAAANSPAPTPVDSTSSTTPAIGRSTQTEQPGTAANPQAPVTQAAPPPAPTGAADPSQPAQADQSEPSNPPPANDAVTAAPKPEVPPPSRARKPAPTRAERAAALTSRSDDLEAQGEKYLYGNGVPENCARARTNLLAAAEHSSAQAASVLGTMYATGHCATRDLATAYRWFGRSLREDPKNTRIEQDLRVLWNQMTPAERQMAMRSER